MLQRMVIEGRSTELGRGSAGYLKVLRRLNAWNGGTLGACARRWVRSSS